MSIPVPFTNLSSRDDRVVVGFNDRESQAPLVKVYFSKDLKKIRVVFPEFKNFAQVKMDPDRQYLDFERDPVAARQSIRRKQ